MNTNSFNSLIETIQETHIYFHKQSVKAVNIGLTIRNWLIGFYILEFEQNGEDRAKYGTSLISNIAKRIKIKGLTASELSRCRQFYKVYPEIFGSLTQKITYEPGSNNIVQLTSEQIFGLTTQKLINNENNLITSISYTHFVELIKIDNPVKRKYYELLILKTQLNVKALKREISTLSYERLGISSNKEKALSQISEKITPSTPGDIIKSHYSQLVTYLNFYKQNMMEEYDNSPIGILLVTDKNTALVEYATASEKDRLFVSKYKLNLPSEQDLKFFIENELRKDGVI